MQQTIISKTSSKGIKIEIRLKEYLPGQHVPHLYLDGQYVFGTGPTLLKKPQGAITHWLGREGKAVGLTTAEAELIEQTIAAANAAAGRPTIDRSSVLMTMAEESDLAARLEKAVPPDAAQRWCGNASMDAEDSHF